MGLLSPNTSILLVGIDSSVPECLQRLVAAGGKHFTFLYDKSVTVDDISDHAWLSSRSIGMPVVEAIATWLLGQNNDVTIDTRIESPLVVVETSPDYILSFSLVLTMGVAREIELGLGKILYEAPPRALIISRSDEFQAKMRSQYRLHKVSDEPGNISLEGLDLVPRPEPPTPEKCERVRKALAALMDVSSPEMISYLLVIYATGAVFKSTQGYPAAHRPAAVTLAGHENEAEAIIRKTIEEKNLKHAVVDAEAIRTCCEKGWGALPLTGIVMGALIAGEAITLMSNTGRPVNCVPLDLAAVSTIGIAVQM